MEIGDVLNVNVFATMLHSHLAGTAIQVRHVRNGNEQTPIAIDSNYDFNFQEFRPLANEVTVNTVSFSLAGKSSMVKSIRDYT